MQSVNLEPRQNSQSIGHCLQEWLYKSANVSKNYYLKNLFYIFNSLNKFPHNYYNFKEITLFHKSN